ncbi:MAG: c-type cytochrome, partial [Xanthobacteraceae bacterium]
MTRMLALAAAVLAASAGATRAQDLAAGENSFKKCLPCHSVGDDAKNKVGPVLNGLEGRKSGTVEGY